jgi:hypothetical protein
MRGFEPFFLCPIFDVRPVFAEAFDLGYHVLWQLQNLSGNSGVPRVKKVKEFLPAKLHVGYFALWRARPYSVLNPHLKLIRIRPQLRRVHRRGLCRQGAEAAGDLGSQAIRDAVLAAG